MVRKPIVTVEIILSIITFGLLVVFLGWHFRLGLTRYFDVDEFAHLHWAYQVFVGQKPYLDFLLFFPPGYHWFLAPLFLLGGGVVPVVAGRMEAFAVFVALVATTIALFWLLRRSWVAIVAGAILAFLPLPFDKFLEIRPDTLATLLAMLGVFFQVRWMRKGGQADGFLSGLFYAASLIVLPKTLPVVTLAAVLGVAFWVSNKYKTNKAYPPAIAGFMAPLLLFGLWAFSLGDLSLVIYSLTRLPVEANKISQTFIMMPDLFFYPNSIFYGVGGWSQGLLVNHIIWIMGLLVGIGRLLTPFVPNGRKGVWEELLLSSIFIVQVIFYVMIVPLKHSQYLIPVAVFVAWYAADGVYLLWQKLEKNWGGRVFFAVAGTLTALLLYQTNLVVSQPKLAWTNRESIEKMKRIYAAIPQTEFILDLDGRTLYYRDPYYVCCLPFGQFAPYLSRPLPSLSEALDQTQTKYIYQGQLERVKTLLPEDQAYIQRHFRPHELGAEFLVRNP